MRTTINIDDDLLAKAVAYSGIEERARLVNYVFEKYVRGEAARRLRKLAGKAPDFDVPTRSARYAADLDLPAPKVAEEPR